MVECVYNNFMSIGIVILAIFMGFSISVLSHLYVTILVCPAKLVLKNVDNEWRNIQIALTICLCFSSITIFTIFSENAACFTTALLSTMILTMVSLSDLQSGRISLILLILSSAFLLILLDLSAILDHILSGFFSLVLGVVFHKMGLVYAKYRKIPRAKTVFGLGDSYTLGIFGLFFKIPQGWIAFSIGLLLAVMIQQVVKKKADEPFLSQHIRLGFYFLLSGVLMNVWLVFMS